jgi:hypothetical protein
MLPKKFDGLAPSLISAHPYMLSEGKQVFEFRIF